MKLRIYNNSIRLRLQQSEMTDLENQHLIVGETLFPNGTAFRYALRITPEVTHISADFAADGLEVVVPLEVAQKWFAPTQVGIDAQLNLPDGDVLKILLEKDFKCLTDRPEEDESDAFPNPLSGHNC